MQIRTYLYEKDMKAPLLSWFINKNFDGRWMPEGYDQLTECCIGEYPWSPTIINYFSQDDYLDYRGQTPPPCNLIPTVNDWVERYWDMTIPEVVHLVFPIVWKKTTSRNLIIN